MRRITIRFFPLLLGAAIFITGCGGEAQPARSEDIVLLEPVTAAANTEAAAYRNLYDARAYSAVVYPDTEEYAFSEDCQFGEFAAYPGDAVKAGDVLLYADYEETDEQIEALQEKLEQLQEEFGEYSEETEEWLAPERREAENLKGILENLEESRPEQYLTGAGVSGGDAAQQENPAYTAWLADYNKYEGQYRIQAYSVETKEIQLEQKKRLYDLDSAYLKMQLDGKKEKKRTGMLTAGMSGNVVAVSQLSDGAHIGRGTSVVAIGDLSDKLLKCNYINQSTVNGAKDIYAMIDGERYEVTYQPLPTEEYLRLSQQEEKVYSTFTLEGAAEEVSVGDFAVIVIVHDSRRQVLSVPKSAVHRDVEGDYVYLQKDGESIRTPVLCGMSDGVYTEVLEGLQAGEPVLLDTAQQPGSETVTVEKGSFSYTYQGSGYLFYPSYITVKNDVSYGIVYFGEYRASLWQHVEKGDVVATVRVAADELALNREELKLVRLEERLADLKRLGEEENKRAIAKQQKEIEEVRQLIAEMKQDFAVTEILAEKSGIITERGDYSGEDILREGDGIVKIADENNCYVMLEGVGGQLNYGNQVIVSYRNGAGQKSETTGMVASLAPAGVSRSLRTDEVLVRLPAQAVEDMPAATESKDGWWSRNRIDVSAQVGEMDNVLVIPKNAVTEVGGRTYVNVKDDKGDITSVSFIAGGFDAKNYWVVEGLTEGMELCLR